MNGTQIDSIMSKIEAFKKINLEGIFSTAYQSEIDIMNVSLTYMKVKEFISLSEKVFNQLEIELSINGFILPMQYRAVEFGEGNLDTVISNITTHITNKNFTMAERSLLWLSIYQMQYGFFDKPAKKMPSIKALESEKIRYETLIKTLSIEQQKLREFHLQKQTELQQIANNLGTANANNLQIQVLLNNATESETMLRAFVEQSTINKERIVTSASTVETLLSKLAMDESSTSEKIDYMLRDYQEKYTKFENDIQVVESKYRYFEDRNKYLDALIGREVGASLFETFQLRKKELEEPLRWWKWAVIIMAFVTIFVIFAIFTNLFGILGIVSPVFTWEHIVVNALKILPCLFLLYYFVEQYNKERNFHEEYSFKSASALTIKAYADIVQENKNKDELVLRAINGLYRNPVYSKNTIKQDTNMISIMELIKEFLNSKLIKK